MIRFIYTSLFILSIGYPQDPIVPEGDRLRNIIENLGYENNILIGGTTGAWAFGTDTGAILDREFNYVTPENDFKQRFIDRMVAFTPALSPSNNKTILLVDRLIRLI